MSDIFVLGVDNGNDLDETELKNIYNQIKTDELITREDHTSHVLKVNRVSYCVFIHC